MVFAALSGITSASMSRAQVHKNYQLYKSTFYFSIKLYKFTFYNLFPSPLMQAFEPFSQF